MELFTEILPIVIESLPKLSTYSIETITPESKDKIGRKLHYQLQKQFLGHWHWDKINQCLITDSPQTQDKINDFIPQLWQSKDDIFKNSLQSIELNDKITPSSQGIADFVTHKLLGNININRQIREILAKSTQDKGKYIVTYECEKYGCVVNNHPSVSISLKSRLDYKGTLKDYLTKISSTDELIGLHVTDITKPDFQSAMTITSIVGKLGENNTRQRLLSYPLSAKMQDTINQADNDELVVKTENFYDYVVSALKIRVYNQDYDRLNVSEKLQITSEKRYEYVKEIFTLLKTTGLVFDNYSSTQKNHSFRTEKSIDYSPQLLFGNNHQDSKNVFNSAKKFGTYKPSQNKTIRIAILNTLPNLNLDTLKIGIRDNLGKNGLGYDLKLAGEEVINQPNRATLERSIELLKQQKPDIIVAIIAGKIDNKNSDWTLYDHFKHLTLKNDIPSQVIRPETINNQYALKNILLGILAKTGTIPYILANPIRYADLIVGLDVSRQKKATLQGTINAAAMARIYFNNGELLRYSIRDAMLEGEIIPTHILQDIFPVKEFSGKTIIIHRDGKLPYQEKESLLAWGKDIDATFYFVEIIKNGNPRLYALNENNKVINAPKGSIFKLSDTEALLVSSDFPNTMGTPRPLKIRTHNPFPLKEALHSVLSLTLLHYGSERPPRLPVTTYYADKISTLASRGLRPHATDGTIPFWL
ncbi:Piwi domain-containing protein [Geminocystis sp. CENA526]|uniref:Piwi domain-containing protein n=1 Tax=Geminocystis sp. CENA526 TaxID=1355871 RepID=UPI003D6F38AE